jgi:hypothetical protein
VILHYLAEREVVVHWGVGRGRFRPVSTRDRKILEAAVGTTRLQESVQRYGDAWQQDLLRRRDEPDFCMVTEIAIFGAGPDRDPVLAYKVARHLNKEGWPQVRIREYLELYGFVNTSGNLGRWNHRQFIALLNQHAPAQ